MSWETSLETFVWVFDVGRGNFAFIRSGLNQGFIIDMGAKAESGFDCVQFIEKNFVKKLTPYQDKKIAQTILSHPHTDHIAKCESLADGKLLQPRLLTCPHDKINEELLNWDRIKNPEGSEDLIKSYKSLYKKRELPLQSIVYQSERDIPNLNYGIYYLRPPVCEKIHETDDNCYGNSTSIMMYFCHGRHKIFFPGDMTPEGMDAILYEKKGLEKRFTIFNKQASIKFHDWHLKTSYQPSLRDLLSKGLTILIAQHHGLESGFSQSLYDAMDNGKPELVIISEKEHTSDTDGKIHEIYNSEEGASGLTVEVDGKAQKRRTIATYENLHIMMVFSGTGQPKIFAHSDPYELLKKIV